MRFKDLLLPFQLLQNRAYRTHVNSFVPGFAVGAVCWSATENVFFHQGHWHFLLAYVALMAVIALYCWHQKVKKRLEFKKATFLAGLAFAVLFTLFIAPYTAHLLAGR